MQPMQVQAGPVQSVLTSNMIPRPISFHDGSAPSYITPYVLGQDVGLQHPQAQIFQLNGDASGTPSALSGQVHVPGHPLAMMSPQVVWVQAQNGVLTPMCIVPAAQSSAISRPQHVPSQPSSALALNTSSQTPYQIVMPTSELPVPSGNGTLPQIMYTTTDDTRSFSAQEGADGRPRVEVMHPIDSYASNISGLTLSNQISVFASRVEAYLFENVREGSMRSLSVSLTLKQREPELSRCVMPHFEHSWHRFVQHCPNLSVFYYRQVDIERLELHGYAEEHEARLRISRFPKQTCEQRDLSIVKHQQHHAELATVHALLLIRDTPLGVIELTQLRTLLSEKSPGFFKDMTRSAFKRLLTRVPKTPIWISGNYIKLRRNFALVPWANNLRFTGSECDPMSFAHQMVTRIVLPSNTSIHSNDAEMDEIECDIESRNPVTGMSDPTAVVNRTTEKQASALPSPYPSTDLWGSVGQDIWKESVHVAHDEHDPRFTTLHTRSTNNSLAAQLPFNS